MERAHSFDMFPQTFHIVRSITAIALPRQSRRDRHHIGGLPGRDITPHRHDALTATTVTSLVPNMFYTRPCNWTRSILAKEVVQEGLPCRWRRTTVRLCHGRMGSLLIWDPSCRRRRRAVRQRGCRSSRCPGTVMYCGGHRAFVVAGRENAIGKPIFI
jgi:hypothetical protein